jgi:hypothetical protein
MITLKSDIEMFDTNGFVTLKNLFTNKDLELFESALVDLFLMQAKKIGDYHSQLENILNKKASSFETISSVIEMMDENDKEALYQAQFFLSSSLILRDIFNQKFRNKINEFLGGTNPISLIEGPGLFISRPNTLRLQYKWHSEGHYYPKRRNFVNVWFPLFTSRNKSNGTMSFKSGSHKRDFPFSDYRGYNKDSQNQANYLNQYEIPSNFLGEYEEHFCDVDRGDLIIFDRGLVHRSNNNSSKNYSFAVVARIWDPTNDLTLSGDISATPYGNNIGRSNLIVEPDINNIRE